MPDAASPDVIYIGPAGWSYPDWRGIVYPERKPRNFHELEYVARLFDTVEINTSFYNPPRPEMVNEWARQVEGNSRFRFTAKLWQRFTHERDATLEDERIFKQSLAPLAEAGKLGALLLQFPWSFKNNPENRQYLAGLAKQFRDYPMVLEVRHDSWNRAEILGMLREMAIGFCNIDQPVIGRSIRPSEIVTAPVGYVRLHGRNYKEWFTSADHPGERYNYLYQPDELKPWVERIQRIAQGSNMTFVVTNNHARGKAVVNALQLAAIITGRKPSVPESLLQEYPDLADIPANPKAPSVQPSLPFGKPTQWT